MDDERVLARLGRIDALDRSGAAADALLEELRALVREAEELSRVRTAHERDEEGVVERLRTAPNGT